jgi:hypothetical protein
VLIICFIISLPELTFIDKKKTETRNRKINGAKPKSHTSRKINNCTMKKVFLTSLAVIYVSIFYLATAVDDTKNSKKIVVTYMEKKQNIEGKEIFMHYYDEVSLSYKILKDSTNSTGEVTFSIPGRTDGASYIFTFSFSSGKLKEGFPIRIPPDSLYGGQDTISIILGKEKKYYVNNSGAPMQWMPFPTVGSPIEVNKADINILKYNWATQEASDIKHLAFVNGGTKPVSIEDIFLEGSVIYITIK